MVNVQTHHVPQIVVIDFDRTLSDVKASVEHLYAVTKDFGIDEQTVEAARTQLEDDGGTFEPITYLKTQLSDEQMEAFYQQFLATKMDSLFPDAQPFLQLLEENEIPFYVLTYGVSFKWQELKVGGSSYNGPMKVMDHSDKGAEIIKWKNADGKYVMPTSQLDKATWVADTICLIDDKASAFKSLPDDCTGYLIQRSETILPSQQGQTPEHVQLIKSFGDLTITDHKLLTK